MNWLVGRSTLFLLFICNVVCWVDTNRFIIRCPSLRAIRFHGNKEERENLSEEYFTNEAAAHDGRRPDKQILNEKGELEDDNSDNPRAWDVCVTTYEVANTEKKALGRFAWKYLVIDEAHRLKNEASMFSTVSVWLTLLTAYVFTSYTSGLTFYRPWGISTQNTVYCWPEPLCRWVMYCLVVVFVFNTSHYMLTFIYALWNHRTICTNFGLFSTFYFLISFRQASNSMSGLTWKSMMLVSRLWCQNELLMSIPYELTSLHFL